MLALRFSIGLLCFLLLTASVPAAEPVPSETEEEHALLKRFAGEWTSVGKSVATPDQPSIDCTGKMSSSMLGDLWVVNKLEGDNGGMTFHGLQTIGYDPQKQKYVGTWVDSMMNHMWHYEGTYDDESSKLILTARGPSFFDPTATAEYRDSYEFKSDNMIIATSEFKTDDGQWVTFMTGEMTRVEK